VLPVVALVAVFHFSGIGAALDRMFFDTASRRPWRAPLLDATTSALVLIDDYTMADAKEQGYGLRWPYPRWAFAALIAALERAGARTIAMDFTFLDPSDAAEQDAFLAGLAAAVPGVVLARTADEPPVFWDEPFVDANPELFRRPRVGNVNLETDPDGVVRSYDARDSLALAVARNAAGANEQNPADGSSEPSRGLLRWHGGLKQLDSKGVPVLSAARFFRGGVGMLDRLTEAAPDGDPSTLAAALAAEPALRGPGFDAVRGRTVFVGANAAGTYDLKAMPVGQLEPGVLLHWTAWTNLTSSGFIREVPRLVALILAVALVLALGAVGVRSGRLSRAIALAAGVAGGLMALAYVGLSMGWFLGPATPAAAAIFALTGVAAEGLWVEHRRRREVQTIFGSYVDPGVVEQLVRDPAAIRLGGERREATVFFCDLAGFTDLSEQVPPETLLTLINTYLEQTSDCLLAHGAYIDKYIGDAVMAVFGAPQTDLDHPYSAGRAALAAQKLLERLNTRLDAEYGRRLHMRIGLNTGDMIVGNLGSARKRNYTVLGDAVNLASRLEGANKEFGTSILVGEETARRIGDRLVLRPLTRLRVKGKQRAVEVSELIAAPDELAPAQAQFLVRYRAAHAHYIERRFAEAAAGFEAALAVNPDDAMSVALMAEAQKLADTPPPAHWEPILTLSSK
jgi:adenylate cyclase